MWIKQTKEVPVSSTPLVTFRSTGLAFNAASTPYIHNFVEIYFNEDGTKIGFKFSPTSTNDSYKVQPDGGANRNKASSYIVTCSALFKNNLIFKELVKNRAKLELYVDQDSKIHYISLSGEFIYNNIDNPPTSNDCGVYRYLSEGDIVYIGQGKLSSRFKEPSRKDWVYDKIEYLLESEEDKRFKLEKENLDIYVNKYGKLPLYNRINGRKV